MAHQHRFFLPEADLTLKVVFDNVRNYAISGAFLAFAILFSRGALDTPTFMEGWPFGLLIARSMPTMSAIIGVTLFFLNLAQSILILFRTVDAVTEALSKEGDWLMHERRSDWLRIPAIFAFLLVPVFLFIFFGTAIIVVLYLMVLAAAGLHVL